MEGQYEAFATDSWPDLQAPPSEWDDSLVASFLRSGRPVQAVAILVDLGRASDEPPITKSVFHGETATICHEFEDPFEWLPDGHVAWGPTASRPCTRRLLLNP